MCVLHAPIRGSWDQTLKMEKHTRAVGKPHNGGNGKHYRYHRADAVIDLAIQQKRYGTPKSQAQAGGEAFVR